MDTINCNKKTISKRIAQYKMIDLGLLKSIVVDSFSYREVLNRIGYKTISGNYRGFKNYLENLKIQTSHFKQNGRYLELINKIERGYLFTENSNYSRSTIKKHIIKKKLIEHTCQICKMLPVWNNLPLVLVLDHINGVNNDNRLENLRFLCPNCNAQTETFAAKNYKKDNFNPVNNKIIGDNLKNEYSVTKDEIIEKLKSDKKLIEIAKELNISVQLLRKKIKLFNIYNLTIKEISRLVFIPTHFKFSMKNNNKIFFKIFKHKLKLKEIPIDNIIKILKNTKTLQKTANQLGFSDRALQKRLTQLNINYIDYIRDFSEQEVINYYLINKSILKTQINFKIGKFLVKRILLKNKIIIKSNPPKLSEEIKKEINHLLVLGVSVYKISKKMGVSPTAVKKIKYNW